MMKFITKTLLLSSLLLPTHLLAMDLTQGDGYSGMGSGGKNGKFFSIYGSYPVLSTYEVKGSSAMKGGASKMSMDIVEMKRKSGFSGGVSWGYHGDSGIMTELQLGLTSRVDELDEVTKKSGSTGGTELAGYPTKFDVFAWSGMLDVKYLITPFSSSETEEDMEHDMMFDAEMDISAYVGAGVGMSYESTKVKDVMLAATGATSKAIEAADKKSLTEKFDASRYVYNYKFGAGVDMRYNDMVVYAGYERLFRFGGLGGSEVMQTIDSKEYEFETSDLKSHAINLGMRFYY